jgi:hypothetical protein
MARIIGEVYHLPIRAQRLRTLHRHVLVIMYPQVLVLEVVVATAQEALTGVTVVQHTIIGYRKRIKQNFHDRTVNMRSWTKKTN